MADNPFLDNTSFADNDTANTTYDRVREGYDAGFDFSTKSADEFAKFYGQDRARYRTSVGANGLGAQQTYRNQWEQNNPGYKNSADAFNRSMDASGAASGSQFSGGNAIQRSVGMTDLGNRLFREHQADLGGVYGVSQQAEAGRVSNINNYLTSLYPSLASWLGNTQISIDNAETNYQNQQALQNQQLAQAENNSNTSFWGSILSGGLGLLGSLFCSRELKESIQQVPEAVAHKSPFLDALKEIDLYFWRYKEKTAKELDDHANHLSPMSEDWSKRFGGDSDKISQIDALGVTIAALKELHAKVEVLERENAQMQAVIMQLSGVDPEMLRLDDMTIDPEDLGYQSVENHR